MFKKLVVGALATGVMLSGATGASAAVDTGNNLNNSNNSIAATCDYKAFPCTIGVKKVLYCVNYSPLSKA
ncbi:hypothetical protein EXW32_29470 (plasmid) [Bacillus mycoides]|uniref:hypothetical protein n=1 Tax=Bacillus mycoides TaxID=1405 RepID=UPI001C00AE67|nr:hypothetical protein [Bacillus mycoides]QWG70458.1 hypothetical protein EXW32_29470 [Bacillus mycoides]